MFQCSPNENHLIKEVSRCKEGDDLASSAKEIVKVDCIQQAAMYFVLTCLTISKLSLQLDLWYFGVGAT